MASSLSELRKNQSKMLDMIKAQASQNSQSSSGKDERFWSPTFDKEKGRGSAIIRFLPAPQGEDWPYVKVFSHGFKGPTGKWYIENSLSTLGGQKDPVGDLNTRLWNSGIESDKEVARVQKRKTSYYSNILVVKDPANPDNEGKVFLYRYGAKIYDIIQEAMYPAEDDIGERDPINPFNPWDGSNFVIKMTGHNIGNTIVPVYDKSYFEATPSAIGSDEHIESIWAKAHSLQFFVSEANFKKEEELKKRLYEVLGPVCGSGIETVVGWGEPIRSASAVSRPVASAQNESPMSINEDPPFTPDVSSNDEDDDLLQKLKNLL